jgi:hypothetical protein
MKMNISRKSPELLILFMTVASAIGFAVWMNLVNNFAIERVDFTGAEIGILQSIREIPGFFAFTVVFVLAFIREQKTAYIALLFLGLGTMFTGLIPTNTAFIITTVIMSIGFHYYETISISLSLQWVEKDKTAEFLGKVIAVRSAASIVAFALVWLLFKQFNLDYVWVYMVGGGVTVAIVLLCWRSFSVFPDKVYQTKKIIL